MICLVFSLTACGQSDSTDTETTSPADSGTESTETAATTWPDGETINVIVPYDAGGDTDFNARIIFEKVQEKLGGNFIIQNISGNSGAVGAQTALDAEPDGKTFLFYHTAILINEATGLTPFGYEDFDMVCMLLHAGGQQVWDQGL